MAEHRNHLKWGTISYKCYRLMNNFVTPPVTQWDVAISSSSLMGKQVLLIHGEGHELQDNEDPVTLIKPHRCIEGVSSSAHTVVAGSQV